MHRSTAILVLALALLAWLNSASCTSVILHSPHVFADGRVFANLSNTGPQAVAVKLDVFNHRTSQTFAQRIVVLRNSTSLTNLTTRLLMAPGCNFVAMRLEMDRGSQFSMVTACNTTAFATREVACASEDWLAEARFGAACAQRRAPHCRAWCCHRAVGLCCNASAAPVLRSSYAETFASATYVESSTSLPWSVYPWLEDAIPLESPTDAQSGSIRIAGGALVLGCAMDSIRCLSKLNASVSKAISIPQCANGTNTTVHVTIRHRLVPLTSSANFQAALGNSRVFLTSATNQTNLSVSLAPHTQVVILRFTALDGNCSTPHQLDIQSVSVSTACTQTVSLEFRDKDSCGVCDGLDFIPSQCPTGTSGQVFVCKSAVSCPPSPLSSPVPPSLCLLVHYRRTLVAAWPISCQAYEGELFPPTRTSQSMGCVCVCVRALTCNPRPGKNLARPLLCPLLDNMASAWPPFASARHN